MWNRIVSASMSTLDVFHPASKQAIDARLGWRRFDQNSGQVRAEGGKGASMMPSISENDVCQDMCPSWHLLTRYLYRDLYFSVIRSLLQSTPIHDTLAGTVKDCQGPCINQPISTKISDH